jgi:threonine synthase
MDTGACSATSFTKRMPSSNAPDYHCLPVGNAGNISAHWMGYKEYQQEGKSVKKPAMVGYQAEGSAPFKKGGMVDNPETIATAIRIGHACSATSFTKRMPSSKLPLIWIMTAP